VVADVQDFVIHTEHVDVLEMTLHRFLESRLTLAVDVAFLAQR
jgi:hypothetical protein